MTVYETDVPGVGRKFELELDGGERAVVVHHHDGRREVFRRPDPEADSRQVFDLSDREARQLCSILGGAYFESVAIDEISVPLGDAIIEWVEVETGSPLAGNSLEESNIRRDTGVSVIAVQRDEETVANPPAAFTIEAGDVLVMSVLGTVAMRHAGVVERAALRVAERATAVKAGANRTGGT